jgi:hypothetical protein
MIYKQISKLVTAIVLSVCFGVFLFSHVPVLAHPPMDATPVGSDLLNPKYLDKNSCPDDPKNLALNGGFFPDLHDTQYGSVVSPWQPFIFSGPPPQFRWVNNEGIFKNQSEQLLSTDIFDAGIMQTVQGLQPGSYYWFRMGWAPAAKSTKGPNEPSDFVGVKVGVDPFGGTDPTSSNVIWGAGLFGDTKGLNRPQLTMVFPARASSSTIFLRGMARDNSAGENRVWFNAVCMEARPELGIATPLAPTATPVPPTAPPTATRPGATRVPATKGAATPTKTPIQVAIGAPDTPVPTAQTSIGAAPTAAEARFARPEPTPSPSLPIDLGQGALAGTGAIMFFGGMIFFGLGILIWRRVG